MPALDLLAARVARRYEARLVAERLAREYQRRGEGLVPMGDDEEDEQADG